MLALQIYIHLILEVIDILHVHSFRVRKKCILLRVYISSHSQLMGPTNYETHTIARGGSIHQ